MYSIPGFRTTCADPAADINCDYAPTSLPYYNELVNMPWSFSAWQTRQYPEEFGPDGWESPYPGTYCTR